jgi:hypothetical protein
MQATKTEKTAQLETNHTERVLQLLCLIAQSLRRLESRLDSIAGVTPQQRANKIVAFNNAGVRR